MNDHFNKVYLLLGMAAVFWGAQPVVVKTVLKELSPIMITFYRYAGISVILLVLVALQSGRRALPPARHLLTLAAMGFIGITLNNVLQFSGLQYSTAINCTLVSATTPALTSLLTAACLRERINAVQWAGIVISFGGVVYLVAHGSLAVILSLSFNHGDILFFASQLCWAIYSVLGRKVMVEVSPLATTAWASLVGTVFTGALALGYGEPAPALVTTVGLSSMAYLIFAGGVLAMTWWNQGVKEVGPSRASIFINLMPLVGMLFAVIFLGEHLGWQEILGGLCILSGVYLTTQSQEITWWPKRCKPSATD